MLPVLLLSGCRYRKVVMSQLPNLSASRWHPYFADINVKGVNKATGMEDFAAYFDLDLSQSLAFGDGGNDIPNAS